MGDMAVSGCLGSNLVSCRVADKDTARAEAPPKAQGDIGSTVSDGGERGRTPGLSGEGPSWESPLPTHVGLA